MNYFVRDKELNILKAVLPFFPPDTRRFLAIYIAIRELSNIFELISLINNNSFEKTFFGNTTPDTSNMFDAIKKFLNPSEIEMLDNYMNMLNVVKMMDEMSVFEGEEGSNDTSSSPFNMDILKSMLSPEQSAIFDTISNLE